MFKLFIFNYHYFNCSGRVLLFERVPDARCVFSPSDSPQEGGLPVNETHHQLQKGSQTREGPENHLLLPSPKHNTSGKQPNKQFFVGNFYRKMSMLKISGL